MKQRFATPTSRPDRWHLFALAWGLWVVLFAALAVPWAVMTGAPIDGDRVMWLGAAVVLIVLTSGMMTRLVAARFGSADGRRKTVVVPSVLSSLLWTLLFTAPWLLSGRLAVSNLSGCALAAALLFAVAVAWIPVALMSSLLVRNDFARQCTSYRYVGYACQRVFDVRRYPRGAEFALWTLLLSPVYPWLRFARRRSAAASYAWLMLFAGALIAISMATLQHLGAKDWRYLPGLLALAPLYFCGRRLAAAIARRVFASK